MLDFLMWLWAKAVGQNDDDPLSDPEFGPYFEPGG